jgi:hypothetical protein
LTILIETQIIVVDDHPVVVVGVVVIVSLLSTLFVGLRIGSLLKSTTTTTT